MNNSVERMYDVGVGLPSLNQQVESFVEARVITLWQAWIGAFAERVWRPGIRAVIAVPTCVGYGAIFNGWRLYERLIPETQVRGGQHR